MYSLDPTLCFFYRLLPDYSTQSLGENFSGKVTFEWMLLGDIQLEISSGPTVTVFSYIDGVPEKLSWERVVPIHDILKVLTPGSATAIRFPAYESRILDTQCHYANL